MISFRRVNAIIKKQIKDTFRNKVILLQFIIYPLVAVMFTELVAKNRSEIPDNYFILMFSAMYIGMVPIINFANIITEEKDENTLRVLIMSNVKSVEYLLGIGIYIFVICFIGSIVFAIDGGFEGSDIFKFLLVMSIGIIVSIILGAAIGILAENQMSASSIAVPVGMILGFLPMIEMFNDSIKRFSKYIYTQQISYLINNLSLDNFTMERCIIIAVNMAVFLGIFIYSYKKMNVLK